MQVSPGMEIAAIVLTFVVHVLGGAVLIWTLMKGDDEPSSWRDWWPRDDRGPEPPDPAPQPSGSGFPLLPESAPASVRIRDGERLHDRRVAPTRRPAHAPVPAEPARTPAGPHRG